MRVRSFVIEKNGRKKMKKRSKVLAALLCTTMILAAGCGGNADTKEGNTDSGADAAEEEQEKTSESDEYLALIQDAFEQYKSENIHGTVAETTNNREDGSSDIHTNVTVIDTEKQQVLERYEWQGDETYNNTSYYTKEGENEYWYHAITTSYPDSGETTQTYYKVLSTGQDYDTYSSRVENEDGKRYESNEYYDVSNVNVTNEGEEELDGVQVQKYKVEYDMQWKGDEETTRESLLAEHEWTEDDVAQLDGMSDVIDAYIEESNAQLKKNMEEIEKITEIIYLASEDHKLVRMDTESDYDDADLDMPASDEFWNMGAKLDYLKDLLSEGIGKEEALGMVNEAYSEDMSTDEISPLVSAASVITYQTGDECEAIELPADAQEITWEQWENGDY